MRHGTACGVSQSGGAGRNRYGQSGVSAVVRLLRGAPERRADHAGAGRRPDVLAASEALELATLGSACALGLEEEIGSLAPGKRADLAVVSLSGTPYLPWEDPAAATVFGGSPERVELTLVDGEERYRKGGFEWHELRSSAARARGRLLGNVPEPTITQKT